VTRNESVLAAGDQADAVADAHAQVIGEFAADDPLPRPQPRFALHDLVAQVHDAVVAVEIDAHQRDRLRRFAALRQAGTGDHRRHPGNGRQRLEHRHQRLPVGDRARALDARLRLHQRGSPRGRRARRDDHVVARADRHVCLRAQRLLERVALQAADQGRDVGDDRDAGGDADDDQQVCIRPSRRKRTATRRSKPSQFTMATSVSAPSRCSLPNRRLRGQYCAARTW
jgi:hypothetical protein